MPPVVDEQRARIREDLSPELRGEVRCDPLTVALYSTDGSLYQIPPLAVIAPRDDEDLAKIMRYASQEKLPVFARGAGTGLAGDSLGAGLVLDFSRHFVELEALDDTRVRVQPGVVCSRLNAFLRPLGRYFAPDPSNARVTTLGSMLALDAGGSHSVRVGTTRDHVESLDVVLASGERLSLGRRRVGNPPGDSLHAGGIPSSPNPPSAHASSASTSAPATEAAQLADRLTSELAAVIEPFTPDIDRHQPRLLRNRCGYNLRGVLRNGWFDWPRLLVGSEGTLALFSGATLHTLPLPQHRGVVLLLFGQLDAALAGVQALRSHDVAACDLLDRRVLALACEGDLRFKPIIPADSEAALLVEHVGVTAAEVSHRLHAAVRAVSEVAGGNVLAHLAETDEEVDFLWSLPETVVPLLARLPGPVRPLPFVEDIAVPPEALREFLGAAQGVLRKHRVIASLYAHAAAGQVHLRPFLPPPTPQTAGQLDEIASDLYDLVARVGGTISGEHGTGLSRSGFVRQQYGEFHQVFEQIKQVCDPHWLLNPGKVVTDDRLLGTRNLRPAATPVTPLVPLQLNWTAEAAVEAAGRCNGCGGCRTREAETRMCPLFRAGLGEEATPRAKANVVRQMLTGELPPDVTRSTEFKELIDLCINCQQCADECPSRVDIPHLVLEARAAHVASEGLDRVDWILSRAARLGAVGSAVSVAFNWALENPAMRWLIERLTGIAKQRKLAPFARRSFLKLAQRELVARPRLDSEQRPVVYFVDHFANHHDPELGRALVAILRRHRIPVHVPPLQTASGMIALSVGDVDQAREAALQNLRALADLAREGCAIVCTEPSAALCLKREYPLLLDHPDVGIVARQTVEAGAFLLDLHRQGRLQTDFRPLPLVAGYHTPCHLKSLGQATPFVELLGLIPDLELRTIEEGCSGMAGTWGLASKNFSASVRMGWGLISRMRQPDLMLGLTECSGCKMQMEQGTATPTLHPLKLLALAYGLMPELRSRLRPSRKRLLVT